uniref:Protein AKNAD1 n=1 Tax=Pogona vitticeps TaxID=103695 RepID=A0A6J0T2J5_9SAUR
MLCPEDNTDDEQEDLPYDGDMQSSYQHICDSQNLQDFLSTENASQRAFTLTSSHLPVYSKESADCKTQLPLREKNLAMLLSKNDTKCPPTTEKEVWNFVHSGRNQHTSKSKIPDVLLRHFPQEGLSYSCQLIDSETIPEISFTESFDETIVNNTKISERTRISSLVAEEKNNFEQELTCQPIDKNWDSIQVKVMNKTPNLGGERKGCEEYNPEFITQEEHTINEELNFISTSKEEDQNQKFFMETTGSCPDHRHVQRQVHYRLPDFSKVPPKVKIPKRNNINNQTPVIKKIKSSPDLLGKSAVVKGVLEAMNSLESFAAKNQEEEMRMVELDQQLEMLTKQAEAQNHIDNLRFNTKTTPGVKGQGTERTSEWSTVLPVTVPVKPMFNFSQSPLPETQSGRMTSTSPLDDGAAQASVNPPTWQKVAEEETLSQILKEQTQELKTKVETFSKCVAQDVLPAQECHQLLRLLKEQLSQLEQNYFATKEKHCCLQLQNYKYSPKNIVAFDPERKVEGEIFKLEMLLEDIKEKIDETCNPPSSTFATLSSFTPCESVPSPYSRCSESSMISSINESSQNSAMGVNVFKNENSGKNRSHCIEVIPQRVYQQPSQGDLCYPVDQDQPELQNKNAYEKIVKPLENSGLLINKQYIHHRMFSPDQKAEVLEYHRPLTLAQNNSNQEDRDGNLSYWEMRSPPPVNPCNTNNPESNTAGFTLSKGQGNLSCPTDHRFLEGLGNSSKEHNIIIHPRLKIQLSSKQMCSCSSSRSKEVEYKKINRGKLDCERFSVFLDGKATDTDLSGSDSEDTSIFDLPDSSNSGECLEQKMKNHGLWTTGQDKQNYASLHKTDVAFQRISAHKQPEEFIDRLCDRQNLPIPQTRYSRMYDTIILSPQYLSRRHIHGGRSASNLRNRHGEDTDAKTLSSTLDHVLQTADSLKKTTEHMMQVVSEDLAKAKIQPLSHVAASQYYV